jgi:membrane-associated phospholipid phosphatase
VGRGGRETVSGMMAPDSNKPGVQSDHDSARLRTEKALQDGLATICTEEEADRAMAALEAAAGTLTEGDICDTRAGAPAQHQAAKIEQAAHEAPREQKAAAAIAETATQVAAAGMEGAQTLDRAIAHTTGTPLDGSVSTTEIPQIQTARRLLRKSLFKRLKPLDAVDAAVFLAVNDAPHPRWLNGLMRRFSWIMTAGIGWLTPLAFRAAFRPRSAGRTALEVLPPLWLATTVVEFPIKSFFRRRRPFISIVRAIVVGRRPGSYSFPSGHSAAAFAGAVLLERHFPRQRSLLFAVASLVGFSRVYLGAHYPGDVVMGGIIGATLARVFRAVIRKVTHALLG